MKTMNQYTEDSMTSWFGRQTPLGLFLKFVALLIALSIFFGVIGFFSGWFSEGKRIISPDNVKEQYAQIYQDYESLQATAGNVCGLEDALESATSDEVREQRQSQLLASEQNYRRIAAEYDARWSNVFEAKVVGPRDTPTEAPDLEEMKTEVC